jgi:hypothetical protein
VSAPTLWEEGRISGSRVLRLAALAGLLVLALDLAIHRHPSLVFDVGFVLVCVGAALAVRPDDFFAVGVLPPLLLLGLMAVPALVHPAWVGERGDGLLQALVSGLAHRATGLLAAYLLTLAVLAMRQHVVRQHARRRRPAAAERGPQPNLEASPAPTRSTTGAPPEKSTTVVGSDPVSPASITASSQ